MWRRPASRCAAPGASPTSHPSAPAFSHRPDQPPTHSPSSPPTPAQMFNMINARKIGNELNVFAGIFSSHVFWAVWVVCVIFQARAGAGKGASRAVCSHIWQAGYEIALLLAACASGLRAAGCAACRRDSPCVLPPSFPPSFPPPHLSSSSCSSWAASSRWSACLGWSGLCPSSSASAPSPSPSSPSWCRGEAGGGSGGGRVLLLCAACGGQVRVVQMVPVLGRHALAAHGS